MVPKPMVWVTVGNALFPIFSVACQAERTRCKIAATTAFERTPNE